MKPVSIAPSRRSKSGSQSGTDVGTGKVVLRTESISIRRNSYSKRKLTQSALLVYCSGLGPRLSLRAESSESHSLCCLLLDGNRVCAILGWPDIHLNEVFKLV